MRKKSMPWMMGWVLGALTFVSLAASGEDAAPADTPRPFAITEGKTLVTTNVWLPENPLPFFQATLGAAPAKVVPADSLMMAVAQIESGRADIVFANEYTTEYMAQRNPRLRSVPLDRIDGLGFVMTLRKDDKERFAKIDEAFRKLHEEGVLDALRDEWIVNLDPKIDPPAQTVPHIPGAPVIRVASSDMAPFDFSTVDGKPGGYNVALLTALSKATGYNFEIVKLELSAFLLALDAKRVDAVFWTLGLDPEKVDPKNPAPPAYLAFVAKYNVTLPYLAMRPALLVRR